ncbi:hypothetical protein [Borreliella valaisiana]|uniref:hypothetical protein n=1 Tax=Borreliella valaisiana TaxID=62088 RepID=UPI00399C6E12
MENAVEPTKRSKFKVECQNKERFIKIEKENDKEIYHTKIMVKFINSEFIKNEF